PGWSCRGAPRSCRSEPLPNQMSLLLLVAVCRACLCGGPGRLDAGRFDALLGRSVVSARRSIALATELERAELRFDLAALLSLALDVDAPAGQLGREPHVLPLLADRERQLLVLDHDLHDAIGII